MKMSQQENTTSILILSEGTQIVTLVEVKGADGRPTRPSGAVGEIITSPLDNDHAYRIRFADGAEATLKRHAIAIRAQFQVGEPESILKDYDLSKHVVFRCVIGSRAYGLDEEGSDTDRRGVYLPPADLQWSLYGVPEQLENPQNQDTYWEMQKFIALALKANPNVLECLYSPMVELLAPAAQELLAQREIFLSKIVYQTYNGYVMSQFKKIGQDQRNKGAIKWKHAMHLVRLLISGITVLREGFVPLRVDEHRDQLLAIRRGELAWEEIDAVRLSLHQEFDAAFLETTLPERPDYEKANSILVSARRAMI